MPEQKINQVTGTRTKFRYTGSYAAQSGHGTQRFYENKKDKSSTYERAVKLTATRRTITGIQQEIICIRESECKSMASYNITVKNTIDDLRRQGYAADRITESHYMEWL